MLQTRLLLAEHTHFQITPVQLAHLQHPQGHQALRGRQGRAELPRTRGAPGPAPHQGQLGAQMLQRQNSQKGCKHNRAKQTYHCVVLGSGSPMATVLLRQQRNWLKFLRVRLVGKTHMQGKVKGWEPVTLLFSHFLSACHHGYLSICFPIRRGWSLGRHPGRNKRGENNETSK